MLNHFKKELLQTITNVLAYKTNRKIVVFESDDWGSIRMPSKLAYSNLLNCRLFIFTFRNKSKCKQPESL